MTGTVLPSDAIVRDVDGVAEESLDLIVIGGGVYGAMLLLEAGRRGLHGLLLERDDFGAHTSNNHLHILHGGLRYLQSLDLRRFRESVGERSWFLRHFPGLTRPLDCLMPLYGDSLLRQPLVFRLAMAMDACLAWDRNRGLLPDRRLRAGRVLSAAQTLRCCPALDHRDLKGAACWQDGFVPESPRLLIETLRWAMAAGGRALNAMKAEGVLREGGRVAGVRARNGLDGSVREFHAPMVINAAGPWCREVATACDRDYPGLFARPILVWNLLLDRPSFALSHAVALTPRRPGAHTYFLPPWKGKLLAGTGHVELLAGEHRPPSAAEIGAMLTDLNEAAPGLDLREAEVLRVLWGVMPGGSGKHLGSRPEVVDHGAQGGPAGLWSVSGVKFTTARQVADQTLARLYPAHTPQPYGGSFAPSLQHGSRGLGLTLSCPELMQLIREESVLSLADLVLRRTDLADRELSIDSLHPLASMLFPDPDRQRRELSELAAALSSAFGH